MTIIQAYQWDTDTPVKIPWSRHDVPTLDFMPDTGSGKSVTPTLQDGVLTARCPPELLASSRPIQIYARLGNTIDRVGMICIRPRPKPPDYIDTPTDVRTWEQLAERITQLEEDQASGGITEETDPTVPGWAKNPTKPPYTAAEVGALPDTTEMPETLPNPFALNFTGAFSGSYDGTQPVTVEIPGGGGGGAQAFTLLYDNTITVTEPVKDITENLLVSCEGMTEVFGYGRYTKNENVDAESGNDNLSIKLGGMSLGAGMLGDPSAARNFMFRMEICGDKIFAESLVMVNSIESNADPMRAKYHSLVTNPNYTAVSIYAFAVGYQGTITIKIFGR
jgi:hypothetical protein